VLGSYKLESVRKRIGFIQFIYQQTATFPNNFENFSFPVAVYNRAGVVMGANKYFRTIAGISQEDVSLGKANIFKLLNDKGNGLVVAADAVFGGKEKICEDVCPALRTYGAVAAHQVGFFPNAIFFPMTTDRGSVKLAAVLLDKSELASPLKELENEMRVASQRHNVFLPVTVQKFYRVAAVFLMVAAIGVGTIIALRDRSGVMMMNETQIPLGQFMTADADAKPYAGAAPEGVTGDEFKILGFASVTIPADEKNISILLLNPEGNDCRLVFELILADMGEMLYKSGLVEPGWCIDEIEIARALPEGIYNATLKIIVYGAEGFLPVSAASVDFELKADK